MLSRGVRLMLLGGSALVSIGVIAWLCNDDVLNADVGLAALGAILIAGGFLVGSRSA